MTDVPTSTGTAPAMSGTTAAPSAPMRISVEGLTRTYRRGREIVTAVDDVSLEIEGGRLTAVVGPSGSGKTTLLHLLIGGERPDHGTITGVPTTRDWSSIALVPQTLGLLGELSIAENVALPGRLGLDLPIPPDQLLEDLGLTHLAPRLPAETSLGEQQRTAVARALVSAPQLLVADEPTSHQDEANTTQVIQALERAAASGNVVLLATHDPRVIERCEHVVALRDGRRVQDANHRAANVDS